jgi:hypothetical protein
MPGFILIGLGGGLASAMLFASAASGGGAGRMLLYLLAPLPSLLSGLGWGSGAAGVAALAGAAGVTAALGLKAALMFFLSQGAPVAAICYLALLARPVDAKADPGATTLEWYPPGHLVTAAALIAGGLAALSLLVLGPDLDGLRAILRDLIENVFLKELPGFRDKPLTGEEITAVTEFALYALPAASATTWLGSFLLNVWLAGRITRTSGRLMRPWPDLPAMTYPRWMALSLAGAFALTFTTGYPALLGSGFAGAFFLAYVLMGLAIVHFITRGRPSRPFVLWGVYLSLLVLNTWAALIIALLALMEPFLPLRRTSPPSASGPD